ncbi:MAG: (d)CMP kinase [Armatimonadota bacterium]|nr:(d)CMP kinase [Armatimonadota bacterium]MDR7520762.1 (d)CMP kinase [Armatimonadota bacterium]MDR7549241.1 (d)CMP kinase [Armatimonadota bacterium]
MGRQRPVVAIDGPTAAGKSTVARGVARRLGLRYVDTGAMYRAVALAAIRRGIDPADGGALDALVGSVMVRFESGPSGDRVYLDGEDVTAAIRAPEVSAAASVVSAVPRVRAAMVAQQRALAASGGVVMEGRDIGTVVLPDAEVKVFLDATLEARAKRRHDELRARGVEIDIEEIRRQEAERDRRDQTRALSPLRPAADAVILDTTAMTVDEVIDAVMRLVRERTGGDR